MSLVHPLYSLAKMVKLFIGNIPPEATPSELKALFEQYGKVTECDIITNYGFVHMEDKKSADEAVANLNQYKLHDVSINVEHSRGKPKASTKLHVSSISPDCTSDELREKFEEYGAVLECDIVKDFAFVHMEKAEEALEAIRNLNNYDFKVYWKTMVSFYSTTRPAKNKPSHGHIQGRGVGKATFTLALRRRASATHAKTHAFCDACVVFRRKSDAQKMLHVAFSCVRRTWRKTPPKRRTRKRMHVQLSTSRLRVTPGMGERSQCYRCGKDGHWSGVCPLDQMAQEVDLASPYGHDPFADPYVPMRNAAATAYEQMYYERERRNLIDYYHRYRIRPSTYDAYMDRRMPPIPPPTMSGITHRKRLETSPYERQALPPPPPIPSYYARERSPIRRPPPPPATAAVDEYVADRSLAPTMRSTLYETPRYMRNTYADRTRYY
ncbi:unnamed protein product [Ranitomeya imitator]|uniref:RNA-binding protein 4 n=1 Tax=Ranitomeya imitator TaxID=111125 RepID=A0ABN9LKE3_9NEOB|nr:unnamed protein product [Ranitomeya imitator]